MSSCLQCGEFIVSLVSFSLVSMLALLPNTLLDPFLFMLWYFWFNRNLVEPLRFRWSFDYEFEFWTVDSSPVWDGENSSAFWSVLLLRRTWFIGKWNNLGWFEDLTGNPLFFILKEEPLNILVDFYFEFEICYLPIYKWCDETWVLGSSLGWLTTCIVILKLDDSYLPSLGVFSISIANSLNLVRDSCPWMAESTQALLAVVFS